MAKLTLTSAAKVAGISRYALSRAIKRGRVRRDPDGYVDTDDLERAGYTIQTALLPQKRDVSRGHRNLVRQALDAPRTPGKAAPEQAGLQASVSVQLELAGHQVELTLRDADEGRLLDRLTVVLERFTPADTPQGVLPPHGTREAPIGPQILDLLRQYPAGLHRREIEQALAARKSLSDVLTGMLRYKRIVRVDTATYALPPN